MSIRGGEFEQGKRKRERTSKGGDSGVREPSRERERERKAEESHE